MDRYLRNKDLINQNLLDELTIIGAGGIGSALILNIAIMGFKKIHIWDDDTVEEHNLSTTIYPEKSLGKMKVNAAKDLVADFNSTTKVIPYERIWTFPENLTPIVMMCTDNMESRRMIYEKWALNDDRKILIDMRMGALTMEVVTVTKKADNFMSTWKPSNEIDDEPCTMKHTIFTASMVSSLGLSQLFNLLQKKVYYAYIWACASPLSLRKYELITEF